MDTNEPQDLPVQSEEVGMLLPEEGQYYLQVAGKWASFLGILGLIGSGLVILLGVFFTIFPSRVSERQLNGLPPILGGAVGVFYIVFGVFNLFVGLYLYRFGESIKKGIAYNDAIRVTSSLSKLMSLFKLLGITAIIMIAFYILVVIGSIIVAFNMHSS